MCYCDVATSYSRCVAKANYYQSSNSDSCECWERGVHCLPNTDWDVLVGPEEGDLQRWLTTYLKQFDRHSNNRSAMTRWIKLFSEDWLVLLLHLIYQKQFVTSQYAICCSTNMRTAADHWQKENSHWFMIKCLNFYFKGSRKQFSTQFVGWLSLQIYLNRHWLQLIAVKSTWHFVNSL